MQCLLLMALDCLFFFFNRHRTPCCLLFFPTRRSSDLAVRKEISPSTSMPGGESLARTTSPMTAAGAPAAVIGRSEEHTSELQSHLNLVCRLLLEKKKSNRNNNNAYCLQTTSNTPK